MLAVDCGPALRRDNPGDLVLYIKMATPSSLAACVAVGRYCVAFGVALPTTPGVAQFWPETARGRVFVALGE